jgi:flagellar basal body rod protein FlgG
MIAAMRQYEANQKAVQSQDETLSRAVNDIAK